MIGEGGNKWSRLATISFELSKWIILFVVGVMLIHFFVATIFVVDGVSMESNLHTGEVLLVNRLAYLISHPKRGDIVVLRFPGDPYHARYVKRIIGLPGETVSIQEGLVFINQKPLLEPYLDSQTLTDARNYPSITLKSDEYIVFGDNRDVSSDSRIWGPARKEDLIGRTRMILYPSANFGYVADVYY